MVVVTFPADEFGPQINDMPTPIVIFDDEIYEALEEVFIVVLTLENSTNPGGVAITRESSLCRIIDDDGLYCVVYINIITTWLLTGVHQGEYRTLIHTT